MNECTTIDTPFCLYDADRNKDTKSFKGPGVLVCSIDNMPTQLPRESTDFFGDLLFPHLLDILQSDAKKSLDEHNFSSAVSGAIIASNGKLTSNFEYIQELRQLNLKSRHKACIMDNGSEQSKKVKEKRKNLLLFLIMFVNLINLISFVGCCARCRIRVGTSSGIFTSR